MGIKPGTDFKVEQKGRKPPSSKTVRCLRSGWIRNRNIQGLKEGLGLASTSPPGTAQHLRMDWAGATEELDWTIMAALPTD